MWHNVIRPMEEPGACLKKGQQVHTPDMELARYNLGAARRAASRMKMGECAKGPGT